MIQLRIENFKCFKEIEIPINDFTILTGSNGNGKSTAIQSLLLLRRTFEHCLSDNYRELNDNKLELNGPYCLALGETEEILPKDSDKTTIVIGVTDEKSDFTVEYETWSDDPLWLDPSKLNNNYSEIKSLFSDEFYYLNAERVGPRVRQDIKLLDFHHTGFKGEYVAQLLGDTNFNYTFKVENERRFSYNQEGVENINPRLEQQVNAWLNYILPDVSVSATYDIKTLSAQVRLTNSFLKGKDVSAPNIGFGISYVLPIIVTGLIAKKGAFMVVENPEAHLHPSAQSLMGRFLAMVARSGVKVIVETHSDHFINGVQIACAKNEMNSDLISINYFNNKETVVHPNLISIKINKIGELSNWPKGFFDQGLTDFAELFKLRKK